jgi:hypothetical protein
MLNTQGPWPTLAADRVFDSRIDPIEDLARDQRKAGIAVYTQDDMGTGSQARGGPPFKRIVDLVFEIWQIASLPSVANPAVYEPGIPLTDAELEAELDLIETQIEFTLFFATTGTVINLAPPGRTPIVKTLWRALTGGMVTDPRSTAHRDSEEGARLAWRTVTWKVQCPDDSFEALPLAPLKGSDRLPRPLKEIAKALSASAYGKSLAIALGDAMPTMPVATPLLDVKLNVEIVTPGETASGAANLNGDAPLPGISPPPSRPPTDSNPA